MNCLYNLIQKLIYHACAFAQFVMLNNKAIPHTLMASQRVYICLGKLISYIYCQLISYILHSGLSEYGYCQAVQKYGILKLQIHIFYILKYYIMKVI